MVENNETSALTKTKAKKVLFITFDNDNKKLLKEIKKLFSGVIITNLSESKEEKSRYQLEFVNYKACKDAKNQLSEKFNEDILKIESALQKKKKENAKTQISTRKQEKQKGNVFEVNVPKIILRNLSFKFDEESLRKEMEVFGNVKLVNIPKKEDGKMKGFGFVVFENMKIAKQAIEALNLDDKILMGKKVVADWCLPKRVYLKNNDSKTQDEENESEKSDNSEESDSEEENKEPEQKSEKFENKKKQGTQDVQEKRTVFVRNLSYDSTEESVKELFSKFGPVKFVKLCWDKELERPKGTCFIQFESNQSALDACAESEILELDSRPLNVDMAVSRNQVNQLVEDKKMSENMPKDNRNMALAKEGIIYQNSYEAEGMSKSDILKRQKLEAMNAEKLKLLHFFVSPTRLSVHNIPTKVTDEELRNIFMKAIGEVPGKTRRTDIIECRIMRDLTRVSSNGVGKSKGYGFVEFTCFDLAKKALHSTNNNSDLFSNGTRLIVQFSIEDMRALKKKKERSEKSKSKNANFKPKLNKINIQNANLIEDDLENKKKIKEKNLIKVHMLERKLSKRMSQDDLVSSRHAPKNKKFKKVKK
ncbi:RNA-binding [Brachionus plicatilis]|uniref:RNA-binding n=1 Tax=Brachionus plicatilis TaxID=10195 RepID=A0A3M7T5C9_BRAPC|nr:RNA-binding [Brachionus plicatilis]